MIYTNDLRIGGITDKGVISSIQYFDDRLACCIDFGKVYFVEDLYSIDLYYILEKFGFKYVDNQYEYRVENFECTLYFYDCWNLHLEHHGKEIAHLQGYWGAHELQNIFYDLTKYELTLK